MLWRPPSFRTRSRAGVAGLLWLLAAAACGPEDGGTATPDPLPRAEAAVQAELDRIVAETGLPGAVAAFTLPDGRVGVAASGFADPEATPPRPMTPDTRFLAGSVGKTFVAATTLSLAREGLLDLDAPVSTYLGDETWFEEVPNAPDLTLRHLLRHTAGVPDHVWDPAFTAALKAVREGPAREEDLGPEAMVAMILDDEPVHPVGEGWGYADTHYFLVGLSIEAVTGRPYEEVVTERILDPLGLTSTAPQTRFVDGLAVGHLADDNVFGLPTRIVQDGQMVLDPSIEYTGGGMVSAPRELARWARILWSGDAMEGPYLAELTGGAVAVDTTGTTRAGLGVFLVDTPLGLRLGHTGWFPGYVTSVGYFPGHDVSLAFQANSDVDPRLEPIRLALARTLLEAVDAPPDTVAPAASAAAPPGGG